MSYLGEQPGPRSRGVFIFKPTGAQSTFSGLDNRGLTLAYTPGEGFLDVIVNGIWLAPEDYVATDGSSISGITLGAGDILVAVAQASFGVANAYTKGETDSLLTTKMRHGECRLVYVSGTQIRLDPVDGNRLIIDGVERAIPAAGVTLAATGLTVSSVYFIYAYMNGSSMALEASATTYAIDATTGIVIKSGSASRTLVGQVYITTGPAFVQSLAVCGVRSWFNDTPPVASSSAAANADIIGTSYSGAMLSISVLTWANEILSMAALAQCFPLSAANNSLVAIYLNGVSQISSQFSHQGTSYFYTHTPEWFITTALGLQTIDIRFAVGVNTNYVRFSSYSIQATLGALS